MFDPRYYRPCCDNIAEHCWRCEDGSKVWGHWNDKCSSSQLLSAQLSSVRHSQLSRHCWTLLEMVLRMVAKCEDTGMINVPPLSSAPLSSVRHSLLSRLSLGTGDLWSQADWARGPGTIRENWEKRKNWKLMLSSWLRRLSFCFYIKQGK